MNDPFYKLYNIIIDSCHNNKFNVRQYLYPKLGDNNPLQLLDTQGMRKELDNELLHLLSKKIIFHDQEPILYNDFYEDWNIKIGQLNQLETNHVLSNSEVNSIDKDSLLAKSGWADFYWFSNGFLSLEWYRYYRYANYLEKNWKPTKIFSSYNRILPNRNHRLLTSELLYKNYKDKSILSCHDDTGANNLFVNTINFESKNLSYLIHEKDFVDSFCHIVTERIYYENRIHLTEKVFRPIVCCRPFILVSSPNSLNYLKTYGFKTFNSFWNESYDNIKDHSSRLHAIFEIIKWLGSLNNQEILNMLDSMSDILLYNRNHFYNLFQEQITLELYSNLEKSLNNVNNSLSIYQQIINNLTEAEIELVKNANVEIDFNDASEDNFQMNLFSETLNNKFYKFNLEKNYIRPLVIKYIKHFKFYYVSLNKSQKLR